MISGAGMWRVRFAALFPFVLSTLELGPPMLAPFVPALGPGGITSRPCVALMLPARLTWNGDITPPIMALAFVTITFMALAFVTITFMTILLDARGMRPVDRPMPRWFDPVD